MRSISRIMFCLFIVVGIFAATRFPFAFSQETEEYALTKELSGDVVSVDLTDSAIVIKQLKDKESLTYESTTIYVSNSTYMEKDYQTVSLAEIKVGDRVTVEYVTDETGKNIASNIWVGQKE